ncbi:MAG: adenylate/guanylate cyclase domain-containing protein [Acidimicrobiia bacterium]
MRRSSEIEAVARRFLSARYEGDAEAMRNLHSQSDDLRVIGSDQHEWFQGHREALEPWAEQPIEFLERASTTILRIEAFENGETGWVAAELAYTMPSGWMSNVRITMVLILEDSVWKVAQFHFSLPVPNEDSFLVDLTQTLSNLLTSIDSDADYLAAAKNVSGTATIMFTDVVGSTSLSQELGDAAWSDLIEEHFLTVKEIVEEEGGVVVKTLGDGGMYAFATGTGALSAGVKVQRAVESSDDHSLGLRIGIHTGDVIQNDNDYIGLTVNKAARVAAAADRGQVFVSSTTVDVVNSLGFVFDDPFPTELKGMRGLHLIQELQWAQPPNETATLRA